MSIIQFEQYPVVLSACYLLLLFSSIEDICYYNLLCISSCKWTRIAYFLTPIVLTVAFVAGSLPSQNIGNYMIYIYLFLIIAKNRVHAAKFSLESHYEGIAGLLILCLILKWDIAAVFISLTCMISSISAGVAKLGSNIWTSYPIGLHLFFSLPWLSRRSTRKFVNKVKYNSMYINLIKVSSKIVPYLQIVSPIIIIGGIFTGPSINFVGSSILLICAFAFQYTFAVFLLISSGLGFIPFYYLIFTTVIASATISNKYILDYALLHNSFPNILCLIFLIVYTLSAFGIANQWILKQFAPLIRRGLFHMFTERNVIGMITYNFQASLKSSHVTFEIQPFLADGTRSRMQNFSTTKFFTLYYTLMDFLLLNLNCDSCDLPLSKFTYKSHFQEKSIFRIFKFCGPGRIYFNQFNFDKSRLEYTSTLIAEMVFQNNLYKIVFFKPVSEIVR